MVYSDAEIEAREWESEARTFEKQRANEVKRNTPQWRLTALGDRAAFCRMRAKLARRTTFMGHNGCSRLPLPKATQSYPTPT